MLKVKRHDSRVPKIYSNSCKSCIYSANQESSNTESCTLVNRPRIKNLRAARYSICVPDKEYRTHSQRPPTTRAEPKNSMSITNIRHGADRVNKPPTLPPWPLCNERFPHGAHLAPVDETVSFALPLSITMHSWTTRKHR